MFTILLHIEQTRTRAIESGMEKNQTCFFLEHGKLLKSAVTAILGSKFGWIQAGGQQIHLHSQCVVTFYCKSIFFFESNQYKCVQCSQFFSSKKPPIYFQLSELFVKDYLDLYVLTFAHKLVSPLCTHFMYIYIYVDTQKWRYYICCMRSGMKLNIGMSW